MKRYAAHYLYLPRYGYLKGHALEITAEGSCRLFPLPGEVEDVVWMPGVIALLPSQEEPCFGTAPRIDALPAAMQEGVLPARTTPYYYYPFDFTAMRPFDGTRRRQLP